MRPTPPTDAAVQKWKSWLAPTLFNEVTTLYFYRDIWHRIQKAVNENPGGSPQSRLVVAQTR